MRSDRRSWYELDGRWAGPAPLLSVPVTLTAAGVQEDALGALPFERVASGVPLLATWRTSYVGTVLSQQSNATPSTFAYALVDVATGALVERAPGDPVVGTVPYDPYRTLPLPPLVAGHSYALWTRVATAYTTPLSPEQYRTLTNEDVPDSGFYEEGGRRYFWVEKYNLGRQPSDPNHPKYLERARLISLNLTVDRPEFAMFATSPEPLEGDWSCLLLRAGNLGTWTHGAGVLPYPGAALLRDVDAEAGQGMQAIGFDYLARRVTASKVLEYDCLRANGTVALPAGTTVIGGERTSANGPEMCAWAFLGSQWVLIGKSEVHTTGTCECILQAFHTATSITQFRDGRLLVMNRCSKHLFAPDAPTLGERLPPFPADQGGHPGGHAIEVVGEAEVHWMTESFFQGTAGEFGVAQFYNTHMTLAGARVASGVGGAFHGVNCAAWYRGAYWTIVQTEPTAQDPGTQYLAKWSGVRWDYAGRPSWPTSVYKMQRLISSGGKLFAFGYRPDTMRGVAAYMDADGWQWMELAYRVDRLEAHREVLAGGKTREVVLAVAQHVTGDHPDLKSLPYSLLRIISSETPTVGQCFFYNELAGGMGGYCADRQLIEAKGINPNADLPPYLAWSPGRGVWVRMTAVPSTAPYLRLIVSSLTVCYTLAGGAWPYDPELWGELCWHEGENEWDPKPECDSAACVLPKMPDGTKYQTIVCDLETEWWAMQVDDVAGKSFLTKAMKLYPCVWAQIDSDAAADDLSSYTFHVPRPNARIDLGGRARRRVRVCFLWPPTLHGDPVRVRGYAVQPRE